MCVWLKNHNMCKVNAKRVHRTRTSVKTCFSSFINYHLSLEGKEWSSIHHTPNLPLKRQLAAKASTVHYSVPLSESLYQLLSLSKSLLLSKNWGEACFLFSLFIMCKRLSQTINVSRIIMINNKQPHVNTEVRLHVSKWNWLCASRLRHWIAQNEE